MNCMMLLHGFVPAKVPAAGRETTFELHRVPPMEPGAQPINDEDAM